MSYPKFFSRKDVLSSCGKIRELQLCQRLGIGPSCRQSPSPRSHLSKDGLHSVTERDVCIDSFGPTWDTTMDSNLSRAPDIVGQESVRPASLFDFLVCPILSSLNPIPHPLFLSQGLIATKYSAPQTLSAFVSM